MTTKSSTESMIARMPKGTKKTFKRPVRYGILYNITRQKISIRILPPPGYKFVRGKNGSPYLERKRC